MKDKQIQEMLFRVSDNAVSSDLDLWPEVLKSIEPAFKQSAHPGKYRLVQFAAGVFLFTTLIYLVSPPVRAWARNMLINVGGLNLTSEKIWIEIRVEKQAAELAIQESGKQLENELLEVTPNPISSPTPIYKVFEVNISEAITEYGSPIYVPSYLPPGYTISKIFFSDFGTITEVRIFSSGFYQESEIPDFFSIIQGRTLANVDKPMGMEPILVTVRGLQGYWYEGAPIIGSIDASKDEEKEFALPANVLVWEEGGEYILLQSDVLPLEEMLKIAESLILQEK